MPADQAVSTQQDAVIGFLSDPATHELPDGKVEQIETHCSIVFLAGERAYKLKRAIRYASLDYTTLASRRAACEAELVLNKRTAPELYLGVRAINRDAAGTLAFDGPGPALDYVVVMRRFAQSDLFSNLAEAGRLTPELMRRLGAAVARFHLSAEVTPTHGGADAIGRVIRDNDRELAKVAAALDGAAVGTLGSRARAALDAVSDLLEQRRDAGKVRRCHGDLRLANICLYQSRPTLFDCVEFNDEISCIDVLYDLAFLLMDLSLLGRGDLANAAFNAYLDVAPEAEGLRVLPLFLALRAATRSYALAGSAQRRTNPRHAARLLASARRHIDAGIAFLRPPAPVLVALGGEGQARTDLARSLAAVCLPAPGARLLQVGDPAAPVLAEASAVLAAGCSVLLAGDLPAAERNAIASLASRLAVRWHGFWFGSPPAGLDTALWQVLDAAQGVLCALASAAPSVTPGYTSGLTGGL